MEASNTPTIDASPLYFYGHGKVKYNFLSQWYPCEFEAPSGTFTSAEQYMMYHKALVFDDADVAAQIMKANNPKTQKALGRKIQGFDDKTWNDHRERIVEEGNWYKFTKNKNDSFMAPKLLDTGTRELVEASPSDKIWGIGFSAQEADKNRSRWGLNLLGKALMKVRERLREQRIEAVEESKS